MVRWVIRSILHGGLIELFLVPASAPRLVYQRPWYLLFRLWDGAYKRTLAANRKDNVLSSSLNETFPSFLLSFQSIYCTITALHLYLLNYFYQIISTST